MDNNPAIIKSSIVPPRFATVILISLLALGLGIRLVDLTDLPLDFHPTRQLLSAHKARGMYYQTLKGIPEWQRAFAIQQWKTRAAVEPEILERLVANTYHFTGETLWVARIYSSLFWVLGAFFLYLLARNLNSHMGALVAVAVYLFSPYAVAASRSFQPDPLMVLLIIMFWWAVWHLAASLYSQRKIENSAPLATGWRWAVIAGIFGGLAIFIKFVAVFFVIGGGLGAFLGQASLRNHLRKPQVWTMVALGILPGLAYFVYGVWVQGYLGQQFSGRFFPTLFISPSYYLGWAEMLNWVIGGPLLALGLIGLLFLPGKSTQRFMLGLWSGYLLFGLVFNYHISTHDYYSLPLIPIVALGIAPVGDFFLNGVSERAHVPRLRIGVLVIIGMGLFLTIWNLRDQLKSVDYRSQADEWAQIGALLGRDARVVALTQDYGMRLAYWGWLAPVAWPTSGDLNYHSARGSQSQFEDLFNRLIEGKDYFLVTDFDELNQQPLLEARLTSDYPILYEGDGYIVFDLLKARTQ